MAEHNEFGKHGEDKAVDYLIRQGYLILERNWTLKHLEADIICRTDRMLIIVEVKSRHLPEERLQELLNFRKRRNLRRVADAYIKAKKLSLEVRFDLLCITGNEMNIQHIKDVIQVFE